MSTPRDPFAQLYIDKAGLMRWRMLGANGEIIGDSAQGYRNEDDLKTGLSLVSNRRLVIDGDYAAVFAAEQVPNDAPHLRVHDLRD